jgi:hypothetical protein
LTNREVFPYLPVANKETYLEYLADKQLPIDIDLKTEFNEILPLLFVSLKYSLMEYVEPKELIAINCLNDFLKSD